MRHHPSHLRRPHRRRLRAVAGLTAAGALAATGLVALAAGPATAATWSGSCSAGYVGLTFDDGPTAGNTNNLVNILTSNGATATVFPEGQNVQAHPDLLRVYQQAGLTIGNHSWDHPHMTQLSQADMTSEISRTQTVIQQTIGAAPQLFRPPYGETNGTLKAVEAQYGLREVIWDVDSQDWNNASADAIRSAARQLTNGQVILMHDWPANTLTALPGIFADLKSRNLCPGVVSASTGRAVAPSGSSGGGSTGGGSTGGGTSSGCTVSLTKSSDWSDRFNVSATVSGSSTWTVKVTLGSGQSLQSSWNANVTSSGSTLTATPNGAGNAFGLTLYKNGNGNLPTATCTASGSSGGSTGGGSTGGGSTGGGSTGGGACTVSLTKSGDWSDRFNVSATVSGSSTWTVKVALGSGQSLQNSWNANVTTSGSTLTATPNGSGNSFGFTLYKNGNSTLPTATCS